MTNQLSTPPDRAETVHYNRCNRFWISDNESDGGWRKETNKASDIAAITAITETQEKYVQQPPRPLPPPAPPPPPQRRPWPGTSTRPYPHSSNNVHMQPDEPEEGVYEFERPMWGDRHHTLSSSESPPLEQRPPRPGATHGGRGRRQNIQKEKDKLLNFLVAKLVKATHVQRAEIMESIHPDILDMMLKRMQELNADAIRAASKQVQRS